MWEFLRDIRQGWVSSMSGLASVIFGVASAVLYFFFNVSVATHVGVVASGWIALFLASYSVWKHATTEGNAKLAALQEKYASLEKEALKLSSEEASLRKEGKKLIDKGKMLMGMLGGREVQDREARESVVGWHADTFSFVKNNLPLAYVAFADEGGNEIPTPTGNHGVLYAYLRFRVEKLEMVLQAI